MSWMPSDVHNPSGETMDPQRRRLLQSAGLMLAMFAFPSPLLAAAAHVPRPQVGRKALATWISEEFSLPRTWVDEALVQATFQPSVIYRMERPYEARPYREYRPLFVNERLRRLGEAYLHKHRAVFAAANQRYGVQAEIIAAILGMETHFGRSRGKDRVLDALYTLASGYPQRAEFFRRELGHFLRLCHEEGLRPQEPLGSYAGAFGTTQFIPSSYRSYAVDADGDGRRDVWDSPADIIHSVAHYFRRHHWDNSRPVALWLPHAPEGKVAWQLLAQGTRAWRRLDEIRSALPRLPRMWRHDDRVSLVRLDTDQGIRTALVHYNFYVITRWNRSHNYAMAATELAALLGCRLCRTQA